MNGAAAPPLKPGYTTSEAAVTVAHIVVGALTIVGVVSQTNAGTLEGALATAITAGIALASSAWVIISYVKGRTALKQAAVTETLTTTPVGEVGMTTTTRPVAEPAPAPAMMRPGVSGQAGAGGKPSKLPALIAVLLLPSLSLADWRPPTPLRSSPAVVTCLGRRCPQPAPAPQQIIQQAPTDPALISGLQRIGDQNAQLLAMLQAQRAAPSQGGCINYHYHYYPGLGSPSAPVAPIQSPMLPQLIASPPPILIQPPQQVLPLGQPPQQYLPITLPPQQVLPLTNPPQQQLPLVNPPQQQLPLIQPPQQQLPIAAPPPQQQLPLSPQLGPQQPLGPQVGPQQQLLSVPPPTGYDRFSRKAIPVQWRRVQ